MFWRILTKCDVDFIANSLKKLLTYFTVYVKIIMCRK